MEIGAVAQVGKNVLVGAERLLAHPRHAFAAHLGKAHRGAVHPDGHEVAADARHGPRAFGHFGAGVVWTARAEPGLAVGIGSQRQRLHGAVFGIQHGQVGIHAGGHIAGHAHFVQPFGHRAGNDGGRQVGIGPQQRVGAGVGHAPFAAREIVRALVELAQHMGAHIGTPVVQLFFQLVFDDLALFFHHQNLAQPGGKFARGLGFQRPHHAHLVQAQADALAGGRVQPQVLQRLAGVVVGLAAGDQAETVVRPLDHIVVEPVGPDVGQRGVPLVVKQAGLLVQCVVGPADVQAAGRHGKVGQHDLHPLGVDFGGGAGLHDLLDGFHARPHARKAAHGKRMQAQIQDFLHAGRKEHRKAAGLEDVVALVRGGGAFADVVVTGHRDHAAPGRGARHVGVLEHVAATVHARPLAIPDAEHAVELVGAGRGKAQLLRAPQGGGGQLLVHTGLEHDVLCLQVRAGFLQRLVVPAQWGAPVAADEASGVFAQQRVALALQHGQLDQGLHPAHEGPAMVQAVFVIQCDGFQGLADVLGHLA